MMNYSKHKTADTWLKKLASEEIHTLHMNNYYGWDIDPEANDKRPYIITVIKIWDDDNDWQTKVHHWADDNSIGYWFQWKLKTSGGTLIVRKGDIIEIGLAFQRKDDAFAFKLAWA